MLKGSIRFVSYLNFTYFSLSQNIIASIIDAIEHFCKISQKVLADSELSDVLKGNKQIVHYFY